jgi:hypothetical protein
MFNIATRVPVPKFLQCPMPSISTDALAAA